MPDEHRAVAFGVVESLVLALLGIRRYGCDGSSERWVIGLVNTWKPRCMLL